MAIFEAANRGSEGLPVASLNHPWGRSLNGESGSPAKSQVSVRVRAPPPSHSAFERKVKFDRGSYHDHDAKAINPRVSIPPFRMNDAVEPFPLEFRLENEPFFPSIRI